MFLVGGFSESKYLQKRIREEFSEVVKNISVPPQPMAAIVRGGNYMDSIKIDRILFTPLFVINKNSIAKIQQLLNMVWICRKLNPERYL